MSTKSDNCGHAALTYKKKHLSISAAGVIRQGLSLFMTPVKAMFYEDPTEDKEQADQVFMIPVTQDQGEKVKEVINQIKHPSTSYSLFGSLSPVTALAESFMGAHNEKMSNMGLNPLPPAGKVHSCVSSVKEVLKEIAKDNPEALEILDQAYTPSGLADAIKKSGLSR